MFNLILANIMDLLLSYEKVVKVNPDISFLYICYQVKYLRTIFRTIFPSTLSFF